ncbi:hypothetical protein GCM10018980_56920 [Streptomyces capoamus]|uniref:Uncharacterized protein n=1 Tax=Streptomyces capoamus TaxID=68183 RepID=A0A919F0G5_9ACTN|nr:hypothetical protein GCM10010501_57010 [Streptomyces libani subsp. rufus]GHG65296.1 hypothetical protein GCM10018980_56920 [Streptomyces capoamus]
MTIRYSREVRAKAVDRAIALFEEKYPKIRVEKDFQAPAEIPRTFSKTPSLSFGNTTSAELFPISSRRSGPGI